MTYQDVRVGDIIAMEYNDKYDGNPYIIYTWIQSIEGSTIYFQDVWSSIGADGVDSNYDITFPTDDFTILEVLAHIPPPDPVAYLRTHHPELFI